MVSDVQGTSGAGEGFEVTKYGHGRVALIGFPRCLLFQYFSIPNMLTFGNISVSLLFHMST